MRWLLENTSTSPEYLANLEKSNQALVELEKEIYMNQSKPDCELIERV